MTPKYKIGDKVVYNRKWHNVDIKPILEFFIINSMKMDNEIYQLNGHYIDGCRKCTNKEKKKYFNI